MTAFCSGVSESASRAAGWGVLRASRVCLVVSALGLVSCGAAQGGAREPGNGETPSASDGVGGDATGGETKAVSQPPDFELDALTGGSVRLSELVGSRVVLLDFWATYCDPCLAAMPHLQKVYSRYKDRGFIVLGISIDGPESIANVRSTVGKLGVEFPILLDDESRVVALYNPRTSAPYSVLIGRDGRIVAQHEGFTTGNAEALEAAIEKAVSSN